MRETQHMGEEDERSRLLQSHSRLAEGQWVGAFNSTLPFKHSGRYEVPYAITIFHPQTHDFSLLFVDVALMMTMVVVMVVMLFALMKAMKSCIGDIG
jgi:hypothetical protein